MLRFFLFRTNQGGLRDVEWFTSENLTVYHIRTLRGKMTNLFGKDAFSKGYIEVINYTDGFSTYTLNSKEELSDMEGN